MLKEQPSLPAYNRSVSMPAPSERQQWLAEFDG
jgi:hypothetical protein